MYYFKYFRNDTNFEKTIRYNELYFAANNSLNDPMDLSFNPVFWDDIELWKQFIGRYDNGFVAMINYISPPENDDFYHSINSLFRGRYLNQVIDKRDYFQQNVMELIRAHGLATGSDIESAANMLMDKFIQIKKIIFSCQFLLVGILLTI